MATKKNMQRRLSLAYGAGLGNHQTPSGWQETAEFLKSNRKKASAPNRSHGLMLESIEHLLKEKK